MFFSNLCVVCGCSIFHLFFSAFDHIKSLYIYIYIYILFALPFTCAGRCHFFFFLYSLIGDCSGRVCPQNFPATVASDNPQKKKKRKKLKTKRKKARVIIDGSGSTYTQTHTKKKKRRKEVSPSPSCRKCPASQRSAHEGVVMRNRSSLLPVPSSFLLFRCSSIKHHHLATLKKKKGKTQHFVVGTHPFYAFVFFRVCAALRSTASPPRTCRRQGRVGG